MKATTIFEEFSRFNTETGNCYVDLRRLGAVPRSEEGAKEICRKKFLSKITTAFAWNYPEGEETRDERTLEITYDNGKIVTKYRYFWSSVEK